MEPSISSSLGAWTEQTAPVLGPQVKENAFRWATVIDDTPLQVQLDGDSVPLPLIPQTLVDPARLTVGMRVWVQLFGRRVIILGASTGGTSPAPVPYRQAAGTVTVSVTSSDTGSQTVTFPTGRFTQTPIINLTQAANSKFWIVAIGVTSSTGFTATVSHRDGTSTTASIGCHWTAVQMLSGSGSG